MVRGGYDAGERCSSAVAGGDGGGFDLDLVWLEVALNRNVVVIGNLRLLQMEGDCRSLGLRKEVLGDEEDFSILKKGIGEDVV